MSEETFREELLQLCKSVIGCNGITECGEAEPDAKKPWYIQRNGEIIYLTLQEAKKYMENFSYTDEDLDNFLQ